jgi:hypothetical protein
MPQLIVDSRPYWRRPLASAFHVGVVAVAWVAVGGVSGVLGAERGDCWRCRAGCGHGWVAGGQRGVTPVGVGGSSAVLGGLAAQRQGPQPGERTGELDGPRPAGLQSQDAAAGVPDDPGGDV